MRVFNETFKNDAEWLINESVKVVYDVTGIEITQEEVHIANIGKSCNKYIFP